ncbi:arginase family protein [Rhizobium sp. TRM95111]|uniref:arginase family protein n=1 Tax=Rhizobium alarense TaxID=2846851 RepID=UPI001F257E4B|nr:arginase family protein [Rhizobium alarense]MCF3641100.1 arginase family protein [Rhizobium alarense]
MRNPALTTFLGRAGDRNDLGIPGAAAVGDALAGRLQVPATTIGRPAPALNGAWEAELAAALPALHELAARYNSILASGRTPVTALPRCAAALATLPVVAKHRPEACVVWFDAHADINTPETSSSGYLGGMVLSAAAGLWQSGLGNGLRLENLVFVGLRDADPAEQALIAARAIPVVSPGDAMADTLRQAIAGRPVYVHLDCDVLSPGLVPTDFQVEGGLSHADLGRACAVLAEHDCVGLEIAEFQEAWPESGRPASPAGLLDSIAPLLMRLSQEA